MTAVIGLRAEIRAIERELVLRQLARRRLAHFLLYRFRAEKRPIAWNWHLDYLCEVLEAITHRDLLRTIINMPPRFLKSELVSQTWQAWMILNDNSPRSSMVSASFASTLAERDSLKTLDLLRCPWFTALIGQPMRFRKETAGQWITGGGASRVAAGVGGPLVGSGGDHLLGDDLLKPEDANSETMREKGNAWYGETFRSRLNDQKTGTITIVAQRLHERDVCGYLLELRKNPAADQFTHISLPAENIDGKPKLYVFGPFRYLRRANELLHPNRLGTAEIGALKAAQKVNFDGQYNQRPTKMEGGRLRPRLLQRLASDPKKLIADFGLNVDGYFDLATKEKETEKDDPDFSVIELWARDQLQRKHLLYVWRKQASLDEVARVIIAMRREWKVRWWKGEKIGLQHAFRSQMTTTCRLMRVPIVPLFDLSAAADPIQKVQPLEATLNAGQLCVPADAPWLADFESEMRAWPRGAHDDQVVTGGYACNDLDNSPGGEAPPQHPDLPAEAITGDMLIAARKRARLARRQADGDYASDDD